MGGGVGGEGEGDGVRTEVARLEVGVRGWRRGARVITGERTCDLFLLHQLDVEPLHLPLCVFLM